MDYCMLETATDNKEEVKKIVDILLERKLIASSHVIESNSSWNWENNREDALEYIIQMKTKKQNLKEVYEVIRGIHSYDCFEFAVYEITSPSKDYLNWIDSETKNTTIINV